MIIKELVEKYQLEFDTHMHFTISVSCGYGGTNCDKAKSLYPSSLIVNATIRLLVQSDAKIRFLSMT